MSAAVRAGPREEGASQSCDRSDGSGGWLVGFSTTAGVAAGACACGVAAGIKAAATSASHAISLCVFTSDFSVLTSNFQET